ncbi:MAG: universal stress protein [Acetobacteraceae bacterium]
MSGRGVLAVLGGVRQAEACLHAAAVAARALGGVTITVLHVRADPASTILPSEEVLGAAEIAALARREAAEDTALAAIVSAWGEEHSLWRSVAGDEAAEIVRRARHTALVVLARPDGEPAGHQRALEAALFEARLPVLAVPPVRFTGFGRHIAVGWKDEQALGRAAAGFAPFLRAAERVSVIGVGQRGASLAIAREVLGRFRPGVEEVAVAKGPGPVGRSLLEAVHEIGADCLLIGAYAHGLALEWLLGGVTRTLLQEATVPLLLRH